MGTISWHHTTKSLNCERFIIYAEREFQGCVSLWVEFAQVLDVPWKWQLFSVHCSEAHASRPTDLDYAEWSLPGGGKLVHPSPGQNPLEDVVADDERPWPDVALVVAAELLLVVRRAEGRAAPGFIDEHDVLRPEFSLQIFIVGLNAGTPIR